MKNLKTKLLSLSDFEDTIYLDKYCQLIKDNLDNNCGDCLSGHHIIPRIYFNKNNLEVDNSPENIVYLSYSDHMLAHIFLFISTKTTSKLFPGLGFAVWCCIHKALKESPNYIELKNLLIDKICNNDILSTLNDYENQRILLIDYLKNRVISLETREKMSKSGKKRVKDKNPAYGRSWYNNGIDRLYLLPTDEIPDGYVKGNLSQTEEEKFRRSESNKGKHEYIKGTHWFHNANGEHIMAKEAPDDTWIEGRLWNGKKARKLKCLDPNNGNIVIIDQGNRNRWHPEYEILGYVEE